MNSSAIMSPTTTIRRALNPSIRLVSRVTSSWSPGNGRREREGYITIMLAALLSTLGARRWTPHSSSGPCSGGGPLDLLSHRLEYAPSRGARHAAMVNRTLQQHARATPHRVGQNLMVAERGGRTLIGRSEHGRHRQARRRRQVRSARVVRHDRSTACEHTHQHQQICPAEQVQPSAVTRSRNPRPASPMRARILSHSRRRGPRCSRQAHTSRRTPAATSR